MGKKYGSVECYRCGGFGHFSNACYVSCKICGEPHFTNTCPRRRGAGRSSNSSSSAKTTGGKRAKKSGWEGMKVVELRAACKERGLPKSGLKAVLIERLKNYVTQQGQGGGTGAGAGAKAAAAVPVAAPAATSRASVVAARSVDAIYSLFDVDDTNNAAMADAVSAVKVKPSKPSYAPNDNHVSPGNNSSDSKPAASNSHHVSPGSELKPVVSVSTGSLSQSTASISVLSQASHASQTSVTSSSTSYMGGTKKRELTLTQEQQERIRRKQEEAKKKRKLAASSSAGSVNASKSSNEVTPSLSQIKPTASRSTPSLNQIVPSRTHSPQRKSAPIKKPPVNPYLQKLQVSKRDESKPDLDHLNIEKSEPLPEPRKLSELPPLPADAPQVREGTLKTLSDEQLQVILAARPPTKDAHKGTAIDDRNGNGCISSSEKGDVCEDLFTRSTAASPSGKEMDAPETPDIVLVNAAAGTGKTTTLIHLATRCIDLNHKAVTYVTFGREAARDARDRMHAQLDEEHRGYVTAATLHSCAMGLLQNEPTECEEQEELDKKVLDEHALQGLIKKHWSKDVDDYCKDAITRLVLSTNPEDASAMSKLEMKKKSLKDKAYYYLWKSLVASFCRKDITFEELKDKQLQKRHYYPVKKDFEMDGKAAKLGFPPEIYSRERKYSFYADTCIEIWDHIIKHGIRTFDTEIKKAQLKKMQIPCSVLLVDECQDLDQCQVAWIESQREFGTHVFFVGDCAQCIYSWRGARSSHVISLDCVETCLTKSWRFGSTIANAANLALFAKEMSPQTTQNPGKKRMWIPYRVEGARKENSCSSNTDDAGSNDDDGNQIGGVLTTKSLLENWQKRKSITLIGTTNAGLMFKAMNLLGLSGYENDDMNAGNDSVNEEILNAVDVQDLPKIHLNGRGASSGSSKYKSATRQVRLLYELYTSRDETGYIPMTLPASEFSEFVNEGPVTWGTFHEICEVGEIAKYGMAVEIINKYKRNTLEAIDAFESRVLADQCSEEEADIILTTCHSAKGLEWDHVEVCNDLLDLSAISFAPTLDEELHHPSFLKVMPSEDQNVKTEKTAYLMDVSKGEKRKGWEFQLSRWSDGDINLLYVAMTRARKTLSLPTSIKKLLQEFDMYHFLVESFKKDATSADGRNMPLPNDESTIMNEKLKRKLTKGEVWNLYHDLVVPLRKEIGISEDCMILHTLFPECEDESIEMFANAERGETSNVAVKSERHGSTSRIESVADYFDV